MIVYYSTTRFRGFSGPRVSLSRHTCAQFVPESEGANRAASRAEIRFDGVWRVRSLPRWRGRGMPSDNGSVMCIHG